MVKVLLFADQFDLSDIHTVLTKWQLKKIRNRNALCQLIIFYVQVFWDVLLEGVLKKNHVQLAKLAKQLKSFTKPYMNVI